MGDDGVPAVHGTISGWHSRGVQTAMATIKYVRTLKEVAPRASGLVPTAGRIPALAVAVFKYACVAIAATAATPVAPTVVVETCSLSTRL